MIDSFRRWTGRDLIQGDAEALYHSPFVVVSHGIQSDPIFCYANLAAQKLWNLTWQQFTVLPSRLSAEPDARKDRERLLARATENGYVDDYRGIRVTSDGRRFRIDNCILWNVIDAAHVHIGQAATFDRWEWLE